MPAAGEPAFTLQAIRTATALSALAEPWSLLSADAAAANTFLTPEWILSWWEAYRPDAQVACIAVHAPAGLAALAPMMIATEKRFGLGVRCLRFLGDGTTESDHMDLLVRRQDAALLRSRILEDLDELPWDLAVLSNIPEHSETIEAVRLWAARRRYPMASKAIPCPARQLPANFDSLLASMPSRFRTTIRSTRKRLAASYRVEFGLHTDPAEFPAALDALFTNHESRWRAKEQAGVFANARRREFYRLLTARLHDAGALRFFFLKLDGRIVAQEYCFESSGTVFLLQEGFAFALAKENIGNALRSYVFEHLIDAGCQKYDFLAGVSRHKKNWSDSTPNDVTLEIARRTPRALFAYGAPRLASRAKDRARAVRDTLRRARGGAAPGADERN